MSESANHDWLCPMCSQERMKYGTNCPLYIEGVCDHQHDLNATGKWYAEQEAQQSDVKTIGIGAISDE